MEGIVIRAQSGGIYQCNTTYPHTTDGNIYWIMGWVGGEVRLGKYSTEKRRDEVLRSILYHWQGGAWKMVDRSEFTAKVTWHKPEIFEMPDK